jgi:hypothetical protein
VAAVVKMAFDVQLNRCRMCSTLQETAKNKLKFNLIRSFAPSTETDELSFFIEISNCVRGEKFPTGSQSGKAHFSISILMTKASGHNLIETQDEDNFCSGKKSLPTIIQWSKQSPSVPPHHG